MRAKLAAGIVFILFGCFFSTFAQSTAYTSVYAEIVDIEGIEKSADESINEFSPSQNSINVALIGEEGIKDLYIEPLHEESCPLVTFNIQCGSKRIFFMALTKESDSESKKQFNSLNLNVLNNLCALPDSEQKNSVLVTTGSTLIFPINLQKGVIDVQNPSHVTLNFN